MAEPQPGNYHVYPLSEPGHLTDGRPCWCQPTIEPVYDGVFFKGNIIIHNSLTDLADALNIEMLQANQS